MNNDIIYELAERNGWMSDIDRLVNLYWAVGQVLYFGVPGAVVEIGCHAGGTSVFLQMLINEFAPGRELHVYDSFQGMPEPGPQDAYLVKGDRPSTVEQVHENFAHFGLELPHIHPGWFEETLHEQLPPRIAAAYLDGDFYNSIVVSLASVWPRLSPDGIIVIDDYADLDRAPNAFAKLPGVKLACDDFFADLETKPFVLVGGNTLAFGAVRKPAAGRSRNAAVPLAPGAGRPTLYVAQMTHSVPTIPDDLGLAHRRWVEANYQRGIFVASGPSPGGGLALAGGCRRDDLEGLLATDPVVAAGLGCYAVTECDVSLSAATLAPLLEALGARQHEAPDRR